MSPRVMIVGVGNILLGDDGVGVTVAQAFLEDPTELPPDTQVMDGGTFGLDLAPYLYDVDRLILVDAVTHGATPGTVRTWRGEDVTRIFGNPVSVHQVGIDALLGAMTLLGAVPPEVVVVGVEPACTEPGVGLSPAVSAALHEMRALVAATALADASAPAGLTAQAAATAGSPH